MLETEHPFSVVTLVCGVECSQPLNACSFITDKKMMVKMPLLQGLSQVVY
jgi:hypothetical protein